MRELSLDRLRTLVAIADLGSFAAAARALHLAPPPVSLHVADLEQRIGAPLLLRNRGQVRPSGVGETLIERARRLLSEAEQALDEVQRQVQGRTGRVRLGASTGAIAHLLPQALEVLGREHPGIDVQVAVLTSQETLLRLAGGTLDIGLVALDTDPDPLALLGSKAVGEPPLMYGIGAYFAILQAMRAFNPGLGLELAAPLTPQRCLMSLYPEARKPL